MGGGRFAVVAALRGVVGVATAWRGCIGGGGVAVAELLMLRGVAGRAPERSWGKGTAGRRGGPLATAGEPGMGDDGLGPRGGGMAGR